MASTNNHPAVTTTAWRRDSERHTWTAGKWTATDDGLLWFGGEYVGRFSAPSLIIETLQGVIDSARRLTTHKADDDR